MKEIIAIIRPDKLSETTVALTNIGVMGLTIQSAEGRGKQRGQEGRHDPTGGMQLYRTQGFVGKILLMAVVMDCEVDRVVQKIVSINRTGDVGDGRVIICPMEDCIRIRTGESWNAAIK